MKHCLSGLILLLILSESCNLTSGSRIESEYNPRGEQNAAYRWGKISLECTARDTDRFKPRPTITSRILALTWTAVFDAWSRYDEKAVPFYLANVPRRPGHEHTVKNKEIAISYAAFAMMKRYFSSDSLLLRQTMMDLGLDPDDGSLDPASPAGVGNLAARSVLEARRYDGANESGDVPGGKGETYSDYTSYSPVNTADDLRDLKRWQPKYFSDGAGGKFAPACLTPHWGKVKPLALDSAAQFRPGPPPALGSEQLAKEVEQVVTVQARLTGEEKALVEFMRDGPHSVQQAGHWLIFAQDVSIRDQHTLDEDVQLYCLVEMAAMDAFIACWDAKMYYDFARPYSLVHDAFRDLMITAWAGPEAGVVTMKGSEWRPYSPDTFLCPPFPSYVSGHSTVSAACAETLRLFTGDDFFGEKVKLAPGALTEPQNVGDSVTLEFPTFTETANMAGWSRVLGGYHIQADNVEGLALGRKVADAVWRKFVTHRKGEPIVTHVTSKQVQ